MDKSMKAFIARALLGTTIVSMYIGASLFFMDSFYFGTKVSDIKVGGKTPAFAQQAIQNKGQAYILTLNERGKDKQKIEGKSIDLSYSIKEDLAKLKKKQWAFAWPLAIVGSNKLGVTEKVTYNEEALMKLIDEFSCFEEEHVIEPKSATLNFNGETFDIIPEEDGKKLNKEAVKEKVKEALASSTRSIDLDKSGCYEEAPFKSEAPELIAAKEKFDQYVKAKVTYLFGDQQEVVDGALISTWLEFDEQGEALINESKVRVYLSELDKKYSTLGQTRDFRRVDGTVVKVSGGDYGWQLSVSKETTALLAIIKEGKEEIREPIATSTSQSYNNTIIGNTYIEVDLTKQHIWFYKNGKLITSGSIVTGDQKRGYSTPQGVYRLKYKQKNATLRGPGYATPVSYWMPFNGGIGIHDAVWRGSFGGSIYVRNGSHGCINAPYGVAKAIYEQIQADMPIVCHY